MKIDSVLTISASELSHKEWKDLLAKLTFFDDEQQQVMAYRILDSGSVRISRGAWHLVPKVQEIIDMRTRPVMPELPFALTLDDPERDERGQQEALDDMLDDPFGQGLVIRPPGTGKTQIAAAFIAKCQTRSLVVVHTADIFKQWVKALERAIPGVEVGEIRGPVCNIGHVTVAMAQTLRRYVNAGRTFWGQFGALIVDEAHHIAAQTWEQLANVCTAFYRFGFTATDRRADRMHNLISIILGRVIHRAPFEPMIPLEVLPVETGFRYTYRGAHDWNRMLNALVRDEHRNKLIAKIADREVAAGNSVLILSRRVEHLVRIREQMESTRTDILIGSHPQDTYSKRAGIRKPSQAEREQMVADFRRAKTMCLLSTQLADEALDVPILSRVILTYPGRHDGRIIQQIGRAIRKHADKTDALIYDLVDDNVFPLGRQAAERRSTYRALKIKVRRSEKHGTQKDSGWQDRGSHLRRALTRRR